MNSSYELWQTTYQWLSDCGNKISQNYIKEELQSHPDYPALVSVVDFLDQGNFAHKAVSADTSYLDKFNYPLLAHVKQPGQERLQIINKLNEWDDDSKKHWTGVVLYPEKNSKWQNFQNSNYLKNEFKNKIKIFIIALLGISLLFYTSFKEENSIFIFGFFSLIGIFVSILILSTELGYDSKVVKQVCGANQDGGCEKVLKSKYANGFLGITPANASLIYFIVQYIMLIVSSYFREYFHVIIFVSILGLLAAIVSIYTQAYKIKNYCVLCLTIATILVVQFILGYYIYKQRIILITYGSIINIVFIQYFILGVIFLMILMSLKNLIKINLINKIKIAELKKWKLDYTLFLNEWKQEQMVDVSIWENDLILGNINAPIIITVACNLYCRPCSLMHKKLDNILIRYSKYVKIQIRLLCNSEKPYDFKTISVNKVLQKHFELNNNHITQQMLNDWFEWMNLEKWSNKWEININTEITGSIVKHSNWIMNSNISHTPTIFVNGRKLPGRYSLDDFENLIPELSDFFRK